MCVEDRALSAFQADIGSMIALECIDLLALGLNKITLALEYFEGSGFAVFEANALCTKLFCSCETTAFRGFDALGGSVQKTRGRTDFQDDRLFKSSTPSLGTTKLQIASDYALARHRVRDRNGEGALHTKILLTVARKPVVGRIAIPRRKPV